MTNIKLTLNQVNQKKWTRTTEFDFEQYDDSTGWIMLTSRSDDGLFYSCQRFFKFDDGAGEYRIDNDSFPVEANKANFVIELNDHEYSADELEEILPVTFTKLKISRIPVNRRFDIFVDGELRESFISLNEARNKADQIQKEIDDALNDDIEIVKELIAERSAENEPCELLMRNLKDLNDRYLNLNVVLIKDENGNECDRW